MEPKTIIKSYPALGAVNEPHIGWHVREIPDNVSVSTLNELSCIEVRIDELHEDPNLTRSAETKLDSIIQSIIQETEQGAPYLVETSYPSPKSRIKTHKGLFFKEKRLRNVDFLEREISRGDRTFFVGVAKINNDNVAEAASRLHTRFLSFILCSPIQSAESLWHDIGPRVLGSIKASGLFMMHFPMIVPHLVKTDQSLIRLGIDRSLGNWANFCVFTHRSCYERWLRKVERTATLTG